jgi:hypothetical protein
MCDTLLCSCLTFLFALVSQLHAFLHSLNICRSFPIPLVDCLGSCRCSVCYPPTRYYTIMPMDASASLMHRRYRMYTTRLSEADTDLYPIEEEQVPRRRWPLFALVGCSVAFLILLSVSAAYTQEESNDTSSKGHSRASTSRLPKFDIRNR